MDTEEITFAASSGSFKNRERSSSGLSPKSVQSVQARTTSVGVGQIAVQQIGHNSTPKSSADSDNIILRFKLSTLQPILPLFTRNKNRSPQKKYICLEESVTNKRNSNLSQETSNWNGKPFQSTNPELYRRSLPLNIHSTGKLENREGGLETEGSEGNFVHITAAKSANLSNSILMDQGSNKALAVKQKQTTEDSNTRRNLENKFPTDRIDTKTRKDVKSSSRFHRSTESFTSNTVRLTVKNFKAQMSMKESNIVNEIMVQENDNNTAVRAATKRSPNHETLVDNGTTDANGRKEIKSVREDDMSYQDTLNATACIEQNLPGAFDNSSRNEKPIKPHEGKCLVCIDTAADEEKAIQGDGYDKKQDLKHQNIPLNKTVKVSETCLEHDDGNTKECSSDRKGLVPCTSLNKDGLKSKNVDKIQSRQQQEIPTNGLNSILGKRVRVVNGKFVGREGKITRIATRGWISLDNPALAGHKIQARQCELLENVDGTVIVQSYRMRKLKAQKKGEGMNEHIRKVGKHRDYNVDKQDNNINLDITEDSVRCEGSSDTTQLRREELDVKSLRSEKRVEKSSHDEFEIQQASRKTRPRRAASHNISYKYDGGSPYNIEYHRQNLPKQFSTTTDQKITKNSSSPFYEQNDQSKTQKNNRRALDSLNESLGNYLGNKKLNRQSSHRKRKNYDREKSFHSPPEDSRYSLDKHINSPSLAPIVVNSESNTLLPETLQHLPSDFKIEIFNRKTGLVMSGDEAVSVKDLPFILRNHAEYEPVIPPPKALRNVFSGGNQRVLSREGRSSSNIRVNAEIIPQSRVRASAVEKRFVAVITGPYSGLIGRVEACMPGGWYLVTELLEDDNLDLDVVIHSSKLELIPSDEELQYLEKKITLLSSHEQWTSQYPALLSNEKSKYTKLRVDALQEEKIKIDNIIREYKNRYGATVSAEEKDLLDDSPSNGLNVVKQTVFDMIDFIESQGNIGRYSNRYSRIKSNQRAESLQGNMQVYRLHQELKRIETLLAAFNSGAKFANPSSLV